MLGTKALQCFDETTSVVRTVLRWTEFGKNPANAPRAARAPGGWCRYSSEWRRAGGSRATSRSCWISATTFSAGPSALSATARPRRSPQPSSSSGTSSKLPCTPGLGAVSVPAQHDLRSRARRSMSMSVTATGLVNKRGRRAARGSGHPHHRRRRGVGAEGHSGDSAAELIGVEVPRFCDHPLLDPVGACRQCLGKSPTGELGVPFRSRRPPALSRWHPA